MTSRLDEDHMISHGNSLKIMQSMPDKSIDCVITDPPYVGFEFDMSVAKYWEAFALYYKEMLRVCKGEKRLAITQPGDRHAYIRTLLPPTRVLTIADGFADNRGIPAHFLLINPLTEKPQSVENWPDDIVPKSIHPNDRDINKMAVVVKAMSRKGDTVLDPFCGSGAIGIACVLLGRKYIGIELIESRAEDARKRLETAGRRYQDTYLEVDSRQSKLTRNRPEPASSGN